MGSDTRAASVRSPRPDGVRPCLVPASETGGSGEGGPSSPPRERGSHTPLFISIKILWRTWCPLGDRGGTGHLGLEPLTKSALAYWQGGPSLCVHTGRNRGPRLPSPEGLRAGCAGAQREPVLSTAALLGLDSLTLSPRQVATLAEGREWSLASSPAQNWTPPQPRTLPSTAHR